jgi:hypothetical protein
MSCDSSIGICEAYCARPLLVVVNISKGFDILVTYSGLRRHDSDVIEYMSCARMSGRVSRLVAGRTYSCNRSTIPSQHKDI